MAKITKRETKSTIVVRTKESSAPIKQAYKWWKAGSKKELCEQLMTTVAYLKQNQEYRYRQAAIFARLYGNLPLYNFVGSNMYKPQIGTQLPVDRPTMNVVQSCTDTLVSRISQSRPRPVFLTDNGDYKERNLAKQMNTFINGELYQTSAYEEGALTLRDASVLGTGCIKVYEGQDKKVALDRVLNAELLVDPNDALYGKPRQLFHMKLMDRSVLKEIFPDSRGDIERAENSTPDTTSVETIADQVMVVEAWHLPSSPDADDGLHVIACSEGVLLKDEYKKDRFPFAFLHHTPRMTGFWAQGLPEQLMGTQVEINKLLQTMSTAINLVGVPRVFVETGSKVVKAHLNNNVGAIVEYQGTKPSYEVAPCVPQELYAQLERLIQFAYQQTGISALSAAAQKPAGLNSGEAIRNYDDLQTDRFAALERRYHNFYIELAYLIIDQAKDIAERDGKYQTVYPGKDGTRKVDLPKADRLDDPFVIQCFDSSSLPRDPAGRAQKITEFMQAGILSPQEGRRLLDFPDLQQDEKLANAGEERILQALDDIVESGKFTPPDPFMDLGMALQKVVQYYNLYVPAKLEEKKAQMLRTFFTQVQQLQMAAMPPAPGAPMPGAAPAAPEAPVAVPEANPTSDLMSQLPQQ